MGGTGLAETGSGNESIRRSRTQATGRQAFLVTVHTARKISCSADVTYFSSRRTPATVSHQQRFLGEIGLSRHPLSLPAFRHLEHSLCLESLVLAAHTLSTILFSVSCGVSRGAVC